MVWYFVLVAVLVLFVVMHVVLIPRWTLRLKYKNSVKDRGLKNIAEVDGHSVIYAPDTKYRKYIRHYALTKRDGKLVLVCDYDKKTEYVDFDLSLHDGFGEVAQVINVKQSVKNGEGEPINLPSNVSFVSIKLNKANVENFSDESKREVSWKSLTMFSILCSVIELAITFLIKLSFSKIFGGVFGESFMADVTGNLVTLAVALGIIVLCNILTVIIIKVQNDTRKERARG